MRLIDADALLGILGKMPLIWEYGQAVSDIYDIVEKQPTAYDVDKVVEELEATRKEITKWDSDKHYIYKEGTDWMAEKAIDIVRKGGVK